MPLVLDEASRRRMSQRMQVQPPKTLGDVAELARWQRAQKRFQDIPADVLLTLESICLLAEQGNKVAGALYMQECDKLGITFAKRFNL